MKLQSFMAARRRNRRHEHAYLEMDLLMAVMILSVAIVPLGFSFARERAVLRAEYVRSAADEIVDGETEILAAGEWKDFPDGAQAYTVPGHAAAELPPGHFELTKNGNHLRLEWLPDKKQGFGDISREITVK
ncbi:MAG TPA: hypothetical protein VGI03_06805 [Verrucomicrobiae bacterium]|jgi:hypothetical protein